MADKMDVIAIIGHASRILEALEGSLSIQEHITTTKHRSAQQVEEAVAKVTANASHIETEADANGPPSVSIVAISRTSANLLSDLATQMAALSVKGRTQMSKLDRFKLVNKLSKKMLNEDDALQLRLREQVEQLTKFLSPSLLQDAENVLQSLSLSPEIKPDRMKVLQATSSSLRAMAGSLACNPARLFAASQSLASQMENLVSKAQQQAALRALRFEKLHERFDSITIAETNAYAWLLSTGSNSNGSALALSGHLAAAKKAFMDWLEAGTGFFYIAGKPGAGKSTLMKLICRHPQFYDSVSRWAGNATPVIGRFFFWKPGQPEQKSIHGMLRGLLYSILEARPDITAVAMPEFCEDLLTDKALAVSDDDVKTAFQNMLGAFDYKKDYAVMLVVDGLDEFEGDHGDLLALMQSWVSQYPFTIKICVSSREQGVFESFFDLSPKFRLHELTRDDMMILVAARFGSSPAFTRLPGRNLDSLAPLLVDRAEGVVLWVVLAIASLEDGMEAGDIQNGDELERRVRSFPSELDDLLPHLHKSVTEHSRPWAYKAIELARFAQFTVARLRSASGMGYPGVGLAEFMLMDEASSSWNLTLFSPRSDSKVVGVEERLEVMRRKVLCRARGFLAVSNLPHERSWPANGTEKLYITFTHRSVVEFLESPPAAATMAAYLGTFDPFFALLSSDLAALRFAPPTDYPLLKGRASLPPDDTVELSALLADPLVQRLDGLMECAKSLEKSGSTRFLSILDAIGDAIMRQLKLLLPIQRIRLAVEDNSAHQILVNLTLANQIFEYSEWRRKQSVQSDGKKMMCSGLFHAFQAMIQRCRLASEPGVSVRRFEGDRPVRAINKDSSTSSSKMGVERLLRVLDEFCQNGLDVNYSWHGSWHGVVTAKEHGWTCWQAVLWAVVIGDIPHPESHRDILGRFLERGAATNVTIIAKTPEGPCKREDLEPADGWYLVSPFGGHTGNASRKRHVGDATDREAMLPSVLMHESSPIIQWAKKYDWVLTLRDLVTLRFGKETDGLSALLGVEFDE
ncbi:P-loop containing nucleoside triphosphate hydrolase [Cordyceps javanica]|uniref:P-loop containing nucleoside triphosphate hydrolase n=1 Tax=Cordyceps javanica TaxID=43265 RepID=A0A545VF45_9HYPO|nr:P-loop containing nucleoside triphosphate hydrolase [Cordyceps javanica]TQW11541.1 P-loop containing nucleoside triphosphate hydrolase [Cordyceps javanica]